MCTVTIHRTAETLLVTMNRDEVRFRAPEKPPQIMLDAPVEHLELRVASGALRPKPHALRWMAPLDGQAGGTWFGANEHALQACLLNRYLPGDDQKWGGAGERPSRGRIIIDLLARGAESDALVWLNEQFDPNPYPSFWLLVAGPTNTHSFAWNGHDTIERATFAEPWCSFSSSSLRTDEVLAYRKNEFDAWLTRCAPFTGLIPSFHLLQPQDRAEWAPLMDREYSATRSITQTFTDFSAHSTEMRYWPRERLHSPGTPEATLHLSHKQPS